TYIFLKSSRVEGTRSFPCAFHPGKLGNFCGGRNAARKGPAMAKVKPIAAGRNPKKRGTARMREMGYREVKLWLDPKEAKAIDSAARKDGKRLATWVREMIYLLSVSPTYTKPG